MQPRPFLLRLDPSPTGCPLGAARAGVTLSRKRRQPAQARRVNPQSRASRAPRVLRAKESLIDESCRKSGLLRTGVAARGAGPPPILPGRPAGRSLRGTPDPTTTPGAAMLCAALLLVPLVPAADPKPRADRYFKITVV